MEACRPHFGSYGRDALNALYCCRLSFVDLPSIANQVLKRGVFLTVLTGVRV
jgi:hypothetical protein